MHVINMQIPDSPFSREEIEQFNVEQKIKVGGVIVENILEQYDSDEIVIGFTGGKDSTLTAYLVKKVCEEKGYDKPDFMLIDHGQHFDEVEEFIDRISDKWGFDTRVARNGDVIDQADEVGEMIPKEDLNERNQKALEEVDKEQVPFLLDTEAGNHLLKTVAMNDLIENDGIKVVINGVRWDEHDSRADETFYSPREEPEHLRVHPILQFTERDVWDAFYQHLIPDTVEEFEWEGEYPETPEDLPGDLEKEDLPINPKYWGGFRSLGSETSTEKSSDTPAWLQDVENTVEREGRAQNKDDEETMRRLRKLGYM